MGVFELVMGYGRPDEPCLRSGRLVRDLEKIRLSRRVNRFAERSEDLLRVKETSIFVIKHKELRLAGRVLIICLAKNDFFEVWYVYRLKTYLVLG